MRNLKKNARGNQIYFFNKKSKINNLYEDSIFYLVQAADKIKKNTNYFKHPKDEINQITDFLLR